MCNKTKQKFKMCFCRHSWEHARRSGWREKTTTKNPTHLKISKTGKSAVMLLIRSYQTNW